ncbi:MAG TPA: zf-HC2 domain-containing protein [Jatrophihabitans sp.]|nr:zf-HC2 domain-containing protein [Jatrophihabitans sp.]
MSDEAVAAYADGVLSGHARDRAAKHVEACAECRTAVRGQREAALALRAAPAPALPTDLLARLRSLPNTTPLTTLPTAIAPDGSTVLSTRLIAPMSGLVPAQKPESSRRIKPIVTAVAVAALAGVLSAGSVASHAVSPSSTGTGHVTPQHNSGVVEQPGGAIPISVIRAHQP